MKNNSNGLHFEDAYDCHIGGKELQTPEFWFRLLKMIWRAFVPPLCVEFTFKSFFGPQSLIYFLSYLQFLNNLLEWRWHQVLFCQASWFGDKVTQITLKKISDCWYILWKRFWYSWTGTTVEILCSNGKNTCAPSHCLPQTKMTRSYTTGLLHMRAKVSALWKN